MQDDKQAILSRLIGNQPASPVVASQIPQWSSPTHPINHCDAFSQAVKNNHAELMVIFSITDLPQAVANYLKNNHLTPTIVCEESLTALAWDTVNIQAEYRAVAEKDSCGITTIVAADANTGAMLITNNTAHTTTLSLLPPYHIAVVRQQDIHSCIGDILTSIDQPLPSICNFLCGPSRTADIEQTMVLGMHGPLHVLVIIIK